jgi:hypothetical protein
MGPTDYQISQSISVTGERKELSIAGETKELIVV